MKDYSFNAISEDEQAKRLETFADEADRLNDAQRAALNETIEEVQHLLSVPLDVMPYAERLMRMLALVGQAGAAVAEIAPSKLYSMMMKISEHQEATLLIQAAESGDPSAQEFIAENTPLVLKMLGVPVDIADSAETAAFALVDSDEMREMVERLRENAEDESDDEEDGPKLRKSVHRLLDNDA